MPSVNDLLRQRKKIVVAVQWREYPDWLSAIQKSLCEPGKIARNSAKRLQDEGLIIEGNAHQSSNAIQFAYAVLFAIIQIHERHGCH